MESIQKQQSIVRVEVPRPRKINSTALSEQSETYDKESAKLRRHLASEEALRQLEHRRSLSMAAAYRMSFMR